jgi:hypothetical protein
LHERNQQQQRQLQKEEENTRGHYAKQSWVPRTFIPKASSPAAKVAFVVLVVLGLSLHFFAIYLTKIITISGIGQEGNPLFYLMGSSNFVVFGFAVLIGYYAIDWLLRVPTWFKLMGASWLTGLTAFDFIHDLLYLLGYNSVPLTTLLHSI